MNFREYLRIARARWKVIVSCVLAATALAALLTMTARTTYESSARLFVSTSQSDPEAAYDGSQFSAERLATYVELADSQQVAQAVVNDLGLDVSPAQLQEQISATALPQTVMLRVSATDSDPVRAQSIAQATAEQLTTLIAEVETPAGAGNAPIQATVVDPAQVPRSPVSPSPLRNLVLGALLGLLLGLAAAVVRELLDASVRDADDLTSTGLPLIADLPHEPRSAGRPLQLARDGRGRYVEALRMLRTNLRSADADRDGTVLVVTSAVNGEGRTATATNLAIVLARADRRVLLLEGDLRRPHLHLGLGLEPQVGLTTALVGGIRFADAVQESEVTNLDVLTSGELPAHPSELLQSRGMGELLAWAREYYDVVVVDTPPLLPVTDAALLAAQADGTLMVVRHGRTTRDQLRLATERLEAAGGRALGVVLNMAPAGLAPSRIDASASTLSLLDQHAAEVTPAGRPIDTEPAEEATVALRMPDQPAPERPSASWEAEATREFGEPIPDQRTKGVRGHVDQLRGPTGQKDVLPDLDRGRPDQAGGQPVRPTPVRTNRGAKKA